MIVMLLFSLVFSIASAYFPLSEWMFLFVFVPPFFSLFAILSFPFYSWEIEFSASEALRQHGIYWVDHRGLSFLTMPITSTPEYGIANGVVAHHNFWTTELLFIAFSFFLILNITGAVLGYWIGKKYRTQVFESGWWIVFCIITGALSIGSLFFVPAVLWHVPTLLWSNVIGFGVFCLAMALSEISVLPFVRWLLEKVEVSERQEITPN